MENRSHAIIAGLFLIVFGAGAVLLFFWLESSKSLEKTYRILTSESVSGLSEKSEVKFKGITVGRVQQIKFSPHDRTKVQIRIGVNQNAYITHATYAELRLQGITGGYYIELNLNKSGNRAPLRTSDEHPARIPLNPSFLSRLSSMGEQDLSRVEHVIANVQKTLSKQNRQHISSAIAQLDIATHNLVAMESAMQPMLGKLPGLLASTQQLVKSSQELITAARKPIEQASRIETSLKSLSESGQQVTDKLSHQTVPQINTLAERLESAARHLDQLSRELAAKPQSVIFGAPDRPPGPGEPGFKPGNNGGRNKQ